MINNLYIRDFALIENSRIDLTKGLNVLIGETGSGKSMLIDALSIAFGGRVSSSAVRTGAQKCIIEIEISTCNADILNILTENEIESTGNDLLLLRREISAKSGTRNFLNDTPVSVNILKQIGDYFIDFHGQHEHQSLLNSAHHPEIFDKAAGVSDKLFNYSLVFNDLKSKIVELKSLISKEKVLREKNEYTRYKLEEIQSINPLPNEDEQLENELNILENSENLHNLSQELYSKLYDDEISAWSFLSSSLNTLKQLNEIDNSFENYTKELESALISIREISSFTSSYNTSIEFNTQRIEEIRLRLLQLKMLKKKYGSIEDIINIKSELEIDVRLFENFDKEKQKILDEILQIKKLALELAIDLEIHRKHFSQIFSNKITDSLSNLGISNSIFEVRIARNLTSEKNDLDLSAYSEGQNVVFSANGINEIEFFISTNLGESLKPLRQVASGGEVSRIMLSIKNILADKDNISCLVFDEIDTGVSGRIAQMVGLAMKELSHYHQIIAISHLPQISALSDNCILVEKFETENKTFSEARVLSGDEKIIEIAKLISGDKLSESSINSAKELINSKIENNV